MELEYKSISVKIKDADEAKGIITGYFSVFDNTDDGQDIMRQGAFAKSIMENGPGGKNRIMHLFNHDPDKIMGKPLLLKEDSIGLYFETKFTKTQLAKDVIQWYIDGVIDEHSIGYQTIKATYIDQEKTPNLRELIEVKLWEGSTVTWGMNELAKVTDVKGTAMDRFEIVLKRMGCLEKSIKNSKSDEGAYILQLQFEELKKSIDLIKTELNQKNTITEKSWLSFFNPESIPVK